MPFRKNCYYSMSSQYEKYLPLLLQLSMYCYYLMKLSTITLLFDLLIMAAINRNAIVPVIGMDIEKTN